MTIAKKHSTHPSEGALKRPPVATRPGRAALPRASRAALPMAAKRPKSAPSPALPTRTPKAKAPARRPLERQEIALRAYEIFQERGGAHGHDREDWEQAEMELCGHGGQLKPGNGRRSKQTLGRFTEG